MFYTSKAIYLLFRFLYRDRGRSIDFFRCYAFPMWFLTIFSYSRAFMRPTPSLRRKHMADENSKENLDVSAKAVALDLVYLFACIKNKKSSETKSIFI